MSGTFTFSYGSYDHEHPVTLDISSSESFRDGLGRIVARVVTYDVSSYLLESTLGDLKNAISALKEAYETENQSFSFKDPDGVVSDIDVAGSNTMSGILITAPPTSANQREAVYANGVPWGFDLQLSYIEELIANPGTGGAASAGTFNVVEFNESIKHGGGGGIFAAIDGNEPTRGPGQRVLVVQNPPFVATQSGHLTGWFSYPDIPAPLWPASLLKEPRPTYSPPAYRSAYTGKSRKYTVEYAYEFENPLIAFTGTSVVWPEGTG